jgi:hypothetical protein
MKGMFQMVFFSARPSIVDSLWVTHVPWSRANMSCRSLSRKVVLNETRRGDHYFSAETLICLQSTNSDRLACQRTSVTVTEDRRRLQQSQLRYLSSYQRTQGLRFKYKPTSQVFTARYKAEDAGSKISYSLRLPELKDCKKEYYARNYRSLGRGAVDISMMVNGLPGSNHRIMPV